MRKIDALLTEWAEDIVNNLHRSGFSGINVIEKILRDPGYSTQGSRHRVLWWPKNRRIAQMSKAMHQVDCVSQVCLIVQYGRPLRDDGNIFTKHQLAQSSSLTVREINDKLKKAKTKLSDILGT